MIRALLTLSGIMVLAALWLGPLPRLAQQAFWAHMTLHMGVVAVAAPLFSFAVAGSRHDPVRRHGGLFPAVPLSLVELILVWAWHAPALHHAARNSTGGFAAEQGSFLVAGVLVWLAAFGGGSAQRTARSATGVAALLLTSMHMTLLGALLALAPRPLYQHPGIDCALSPLDDQHLGGAIMLLVGGIAYLGGGLWLTRVLLRHRRSGNVEATA